MTKIILMKHAPIIFLLLIAGTLFASQDNQRKTMLIGTKEAEPFVFKEDANGWSGLSIELWNEIAKQLKIDFKFKEYTLSGMLEALEKGEIDAAVAPLTITSEREKTIDFTQPFFISGLSIAIKARSGKSILSVAQRFLSLEFLSVAGLLTLLLFAVGTAAWLAERRKNPKEFPSSPGKGIFSGFWWAAVTMTTVGYGDKSPRTLWGRIIGLFWMFAGIIIISSFTAAIASALTVSQLDSQISELADLFDVKTGTVTNSASAEFMTERGIEFKSFTDTESGIQALVKGEIDAFVYDTPILKYLINSKDISSIIKIIPVQSILQYYGFGLKHGSPLREEINIALLRLISEKKWQRRIRIYMGD